MKVIVFKTRYRECSHWSSYAKRVNDIQIGNDYYRQMCCTECGNYKVKIDIADYDSRLIPQIIKVK